MVMDGDGGAYDCRLEISTFGEDLRRKIRPDFLIKILEPTLLAVTIDQFPTKKPWTDSETDGPEIGPSGLVTIGFH